MGREYGSLAKQVFGSIVVFCLTETEKEEYVRRELSTLYFEFSWKNRCEEIIYCYSVILLSLIKI